MKIQKILNNNAVIVREGDQENIVMGMGLGYQKKVNDLINCSLIEKVFVKADQEYSSLEQMVKRNSKEYYYLAEEIISHAEQQLSVKLNDHIHISLSEYLSFTVERFKTGIMIHNILLSEIRLLYPVEYKVGSWALKRISQRLGVIMPEDEAGYIALQIHTAKMWHADMTMHITTMIKEMMEIIEDRFCIDLKNNIMDYQRLLMHMRFALQRLLTGMEMCDIDPDLLDMIRIKYKDEFYCAQVIARNILQEYEYELPDNELGYIALHIRRISQSRE